MATPHRSADDAAASPRRRGEVLKRAIFDAALDQLSAVGWKRLTMEGVAACAQTGKAALYRRWPSKEQLVFAALDSALPGIDAPPDRGSLRDDLIFLLDRMRVAMYSPAGCALRAIMDELEHEHARVFHSLVFDKVLAPSRRVTAEVIRRGIGRGEVRADVDVDLVADVGPAVMLFRSKTGGPLSADFPARVVDQVLLPMLRP